MKRFFTLILTCALCSHVFAGTAKVYAYSSPQKGGYVYVNTSNSAPSEYSKTKDDATGSGIAGDKTFYLFYQANAGYIFSNWYKTSEDDYNNATELTNSSNLTAQGQEVTQSATGFGEKASYYVAIFKPITYVVAFDGNGSTDGTMENLNCTYDVSQALPANAFSRQYTVTFNPDGGTCATTSAEEVYTFAEWNTLADGSGTAIGNNAEAKNLTIVASETVTLFAQWTGTAIQLPEATKENQVLEGWYDGETKVGEAGDDYIPAKTVELVAHWVDKYTPEFYGADYALKVGEQQADAFSFHRVSSPQAHIECTIDPINNGDGQVIEYDAATNTIIAHNAGTATIYFAQEETPTIASGESEKYTYTVTKHDNTLSCSWTNWENTIYIHESAEVTFGSDNTDYTGSPLQYTQTKGEEVATLESVDATTAKVTASYNKDYATWHVFQPENYKYNAANGDMTLRVIYKTSPECYVFEDYNEHTFSTSITDWSGHYETPIALNSPVEKIYFEAKKSGYNYFVVQYSKDNCANWTTLGSPDLNDEYQSFSYSFPKLEGNERVTHVRFGANSGATLQKWYKNIKISRKTYLNLVDESNKALTTLTMPTNTIENTTKAKFFVNYSTCADKINVAVDDDHFSVEPASFESNGDNMDNPTEINVSYTSAIPGVHTATVTVYTDYTQRTFTVTGITEKKTQTITWAQGFEGETLSLPVGLKTGENVAVATASSGNVVYFTSGDQSIIKVAEDGFSFEVVGAGTTTLTAFADGNSDWKPVTDTKTVIATDKKIQIIQWNQNLTKGLALEDVITLNAQVAILNAQTGEANYNAERTALLTYSCPENNGIISLSGNQITVLAYGQTSVTASVEGDDDYEAAEMTLTVRVRKPSDGCETPNVLEYSELQLFSMNMDLTNWTTPEITSTIIPLDASEGKPDKLSFQYEGENYSIGLIKLFKGNIIAQQRVNGTWSDVAGSDVTPTVGTWAMKENLQLDENANAIRFVRPAGGQGYHNVKDIQVSLMQYLKTDATIIDLGEIRAGEERRDGHIPFVYSDVKGDLTVTLSNADPDLTIDKVIELNCGAHGSSSLPFTFLPMTANDYWTEQVTIADPISGLSFSVMLVAKVTKADQWIVWNPVQEMVLPDVPVLDAYSTSGLPIEYEIINGNELASIEDGKVIMDKPGTITIRATQPGNAVYPAAIPVDRTFIIHRTKFVFTNDPEQENMWTEPENWQPTDNVNRTMPLYCDSVDIRSNVVLSTEEAVYDLHLYDHDTLFITSTGGLTVGAGGVVLEGEGKGHIVIEGYLRVSPESAFELPEATVIVTGKGYIGSPLQSDEHFKGFFSNDEQVIFKGALLPNKGVQEITLPAECLNILANSFVAPVDLLQLEETDFVNAEATVNLYDVANEQYTALPIYTLPELVAEGVPTQLQPLQGFGVLANTDGAAVNFDYNRLVWNGHYGVQTARTALKAGSEVAKLGLSLEANGQTDQTLLLESDQYNTAFENGYDAHKITSGAQNIFAVSNLEHLSVDATPQIADTYVGIRSGEATQYTLVFSRVSDDSKWSLVDYEKKIMMDIKQGETYAFETEANSLITSRFQVVNRGAEIPGIATGLDDANEELKAHKVLKNNQIFIIKNGIWYTITGAKVRY